MNSFVIQGRGGEARRYSRKKRNRGEEEGKMKKEKIETLTSLQQLINIVTKTSGAAVFVSLTAKV